MSPTRLIGKPCQRHLNSAYAAAVLADSPKAYWQMQECTSTPQDSSGNMLDMTSWNGWEHDYRQRAFLTDTLDRSMFWIGGRNPQRNPQVSTVTSNWTLELFVQVDVITLSDQTLFYNGNSGANGWGLLIGTDMKLRALAGGVAFGTRSNGTLSLSTPYHVALRNSGGTWTYFINGSPDPVTNSISPGTPSGPTKVGDSAHAGYFGHAALYESGLSDARIAAHYAAR